MSSLFDLAKKLRKDINVGVENIRGNVRAVSNPQARNNWLTGTAQTVGTAIDKTVSNPKINPFVPSNYESAAKQMRVISNSKVAPSAIRSVSKYAAPILDSGVGASKYIQGQIINPLREGVKTFADDRNSKATRAIGALQAASGIWSATPAGLAENFFTGMVATGASGFRNPTEDPGEVRRRLVKNVTEPVSVSENMGVKNPYLGLGIDLVAGNPYGAYKLVKGGLKLPVKAGNAAKKAGELVETAKNTRVRIRNPFKVAEEIESTEITPLRLSEIVGERSNGTRYRQKIGKGGFQKVEDIGFKTNAGTYWDTERPTQLVEVSPGKYRSVYTDTGEEAGKQLRTPVRRRALVADPNNSRRLVSNEAYGAMAGFEPEYDEDGNFVGIKFNPTKAGIGIAAMGGIRAVKNKADDFTAVADVIEPKKRLANLLNDPTRLLQMGYSKTQIDQIGPLEARRIIENGIFPTNYQAYNTGKTGKAAKQATKTLMPGDLVETSPRVYDVVPPGPPRKKLVQTIGDDEMDAKAFQALTGENKDLLDNPGVKQRVNAWINDIFAPLKNTSEDFQQSYLNWMGDRINAHVDANSYAYRYKDIPKEQAWDFIDYIQGESKVVPKGLTATAKQLRAELDNLFSEAQAAGLTNPETGAPISYRQNYLTQIWANPAEEVEEVAKKLGKRFKYANERIIPSYKRGMSGGLKPKYNHPAPIIGEYVETMKRSIANRKLFNELKEKGLIVEASVAQRHPEAFQVVSAPGFPKNLTKDFEGNTVMGEWYAPGRIAEMLNKTFSGPSNKPIDRFLRIGAKVNSTWQDVRLAGGVPGTPINSFALNQARREIQGLRVKAPIINMIDSIIPKRAAQIIQNKSGVIKEMNSFDLSVGRGKVGGWDYKQIYDPNNIGLKGKAADFWRRAVNAPTFEKYLPLAQIRMYEDIKAVHIKAGKPDLEAARIAAANVKGFWGIPGSTGRDQSLQNAFGTFFFAPQYRETMVNAWTNSLKAVAQIPGNAVNGRTLVQPENEMVVRALLGSMVVFGVQQAINHASQGGWTWENPPGKELTSLVNLGNGRTVGIPWEPSTLTVPRAIFQGSMALVRGDDKTAKSEFGKLFSMPISMVSSLAGNKDYFQNEIVNELDSMPEKRRKQLAYAAGQFMPNPITEFYGDYRKRSEGQNIPWYETASKALELPFRFYSTDSVNNQPFWSEYNENKKFAERYQELKYQDPKKALDFLQQNKDKIDSYNVQKSYVSQYYGQNKDSDVLQGYLAKTGQLKAPVRARAAGPQRIQTDRVTRDFIKERVKLGDNVSDEELRAAYLGDIQSLASKTKYDQSIKTSKLFAKISDIENNENLNDQQKDVIFDAIAAEAKINREDIDYYQVARQNNDIKLAFVEDYLSTTPKEKWFNSLSLLTQEVNGSRVLAPGVITDLVDAGYISKSEGNRLKNTTYDSKTGSFKTKPGSSKSVKVKGSLPSVKLPSITPVKASLSGGQSSLPSVSVDLPKAPSKLLPDSNASFADLLAVTRETIKPVEFDRNRVKVRVPAA